MRDSNAHRYSRTGIVGCCLSLPDALFVYMWSIGIGVAEAAGADIGIAGATIAGAGGAKPVRILR
jgi:hypothetical protein